MRFTHDPPHGQDGGEEDVMSDIPTITIDMDKPCTKCKQKGVMPNGLCMKCVIKLLPQILGKKKL
jgi:hypothetical protein